MTVAKQIKTMYDSVVELLEKFPTLRDSDEKLIATIWLKELGGRDKAMEIDGMSLLQIFAENKRLSSTESIGRARRKAQELNEHLRGSAYVAKHKEQEEVKAVIKSIN